MTKADHKLTDTWGSGPRSEAYREKQTRLIEEGNIDQVYAEEYRTLQEKFGNKYDQAFDEMIDYAKENGWIGKDPRTGKPFSGGEV